MSTLFFTFCALFTHFFLEKRWFLYQIAHFCALFWDSIIFFKIQFITSFTETFPVWHCQIILPLTLLQHVLFLHLFPVLFLCIFHDLCHCLLLSDSWQFSLHLLIFPSDGWSVFCIDAPLPDWLSSRIPRISSVVCCVYIISAKWISRSISRLLPVMDPVHDIFVT